MGLLKKICKNKISLVIMAGIIAFVIYTLVVKRDIDLVRYEEELLGIEISEYVETSEGKVDVDYARVELVVKQGCETKILKEIKDTCGELKNVDEVALYNNDYVDNIKKDAECVYFTFREGEKAKTRVIYIFVVYDENEQLHLHIIG